MGLGQVKLIQIQHRVLGLFEAQVALKQSKRSSRFTNTNIQNYRARCEKCDLPQEPGATLELLACHSHLSFSHCAVKKNPKFKCQTIFPNTPGPCRAARSHAPAASSCPEASSVLPKLHHAARAQACADTFELRGGTPTQSRVARNSCHSRPEH